MTPYSHVSAITYLMDVSFPMWTGLVTTYTIHNQMCLSLQVYIAMVTDITSNIQTEVCTSPSPHSTTHQAHTQSPGSPLNRLTHNHPVLHSPGNHPVPHSLCSHDHAASHIHIPLLPHSPGSHTITLSPTSRDGLPSARPGTASVRYGPRRRKLA